MVVLHPIKVHRYTSLPILLACLFMLSPIQGVAQEKGAAFFALLSDKFPCDTALKAFESVEVPALATLYGTFGTDPRCLKRWFEIAGERSHVLEIHFSNEACRRNKRCDAREFEPTLSVSEYNRRLEQRDPELLQKLKKHAEEITALTSPLFKKNCEYILSTGLEDNYTTKAYTVVLEVLRGVWPHKIARSPVGSPIKAERLTADYLEGHGATPAFAPGTPCIVNLDGQDMEFQHRPPLTKNRLSWDGVKRYVDEYSKRCRVTFLWSAPWQGILSDKFQPPLERKYRVSEEDVKAVGELLRGMQAK